MTTKRHRGAVWGDERFLCRECGNGSRTPDMGQNSLNYTFKIAEFYYLVSYTRQS